MVKKLKQKTKAKAKPKTKAVSKSGKASSTASQNVTVNVGGKGGGGKARQRAPARQPVQQPIQQAQYQGPTGYDFAQLKNDILTNVGSKITEYAGNKAGDILGLNTGTTSTSTNYDIAGLIGAGSLAAKTAYDIYKDYSETERLQRQHKVANVPIPTAQPVNPPDLGGVISRPLPVPRKPLHITEPKREEKEREVKENPTNYDVPPRVRTKPEVSVVPEVKEEYKPPQIGVRPERKALPSQPFVRRKTPAELSTEMMLADRDRRNKMTQEAKEAGKPVVPFMNDMNVRTKPSVSVVPFMNLPSQIARRPERQALPTVIERKPEFEFSIGEEPKEIIRADHIPVVMPPSFLKRNLPERLEKRQEQRDYKHAEQVNQMMEKISNEEFVKRGMVDIARMKEQLKVADVLQQPVKSNPSISNEQFIENTRKEILEMKKELKQPVPASIPAYLEFIKETKMKQTPLQVKTGIILNQPIPIIKTERGKPTQAEVIKAPQASKAIIGYMPVKKEEEKKVEIPNQTKSVLPQEIEKQRKAKAREAGLKNIETIEKKEREEEQKKEEAKIKRELKEREKEIEKQLKEREKERKKEEARIKKELATKSKLEAKNKK